jgi:O-antigen ligase
MENHQQPNGAVSQFTDFEPEPSRTSGVIFILLCVALVFATVAYGAVDVWALGALSLIAGVIAVLWLGEAFFKKQFYCNTSLVLAPLIGLIGIGLVQLLPLRSSARADELLGIPATASLSLNPYATRLFIVQLIVYFVFFAASLTFVNNQKRLRNLVLLIIIFGATMAFFGILQWLTSPESYIYGLRPTPDAIPFASFVNQHHFAALMNMTLGLTLGILFGGAVKKDKNLLLLIAAFLMGIAIFLTGSRGAVVSFVGVLGFVLAPRFLPQKNAASGEKIFSQNQFFLLIGVIVLVVGLFGAVVLLGGDQSLLRGAAFQNKTADFSSGRTHFWSVALKIFFDYPILGVGLNAFGAAFTRYDDWNGVFRVEQAHNDYLQTLADAGIIGFACVAAFIYFLFRQSLAIIKSSTSDFRRGVAQGALAGCFGILIHSFFDFPLRTPANALFFLTLATIAVVSIYYPKIERPRREHKKSSEY